MPGIPLVTRESSSCSRSTDQMCREDIRQHLSAEEEMEAEESLSLYCKPVELYNILQRRAIRNPLFLQRCLHYKIQAKNKRRIQMTLSLSETLNGDLQSHNIFPLYILLGRLVSDIGVAEYSAVYRFTRMCVITNFAGVGGSNQTQANFVLPEVNKLALEAKSGSVSILLVSYVGAQISASGVDVTKGHRENVGGCCLFGKVQLDALCASLEKSPNLILGQRVEMISTVDMNTCFLKLGSFKDEKYVSIQMPNASETLNASKCVHLYVTAEEFGAKEKSPYHSYTFSNVRSTSSTHLIRLRAGNVIFNYKYYNNKLQKTEVTEDFSCPFCLVKCASFKGLRYHLPTSHDLFNYEFWVNEEFQAVNISLKAEIWRPEIVVGGVDPKQQTFFFCSKKSRIKRSKNLTRRKHMHPLISQSNTQVGACEFLDMADGGNSLANANSGTGECAEHCSSGFDIAGVSASPAYPDADCGQSSSGNNLLQFAKTRKLSIEQSENRNRSLLHKRHFFHSHRAQPMAIQQVLSDRDSEDEVDDDVAGFEDRRLLDDFVDVTKDEKQIMHFWNSFVRKQRVLADSHIPWACEAFTKLHEPHFVRAPSLLWCWRLFMIKLWNHGLLDARTMNKCNIILEQFQKPDVDAGKG